MTSSDSPFAVTVILAALAALFAVGCAGVSGELRSQDAAFDGDDGQTPTDAEADPAGASADGRATDEPNDAGSAAETRPVVEIPTEWDSEADEVFGRYWLYWEAFAAAYGPPQVDPNYEPLRVLSTDENWASLQDQMQRFVDDEVVLVLPEVSITDHMIRIPNPSVMADEEGSEVVLQDCWIDDFVQQTLDGEVVEQTREAKLMNVTMQVVGGEWRVAGVTEATPESDGYELCQEQLS